VGGETYARNHGKVRDLLLKGKRTTGHKAISTGHSQGGAHAQNLAVHNPDLVSEVVTFSSPGIAEEDARAFDAQNQDDTPVTHYGGTVDPVPETGERALRGRVREVDRPSGWSPISDHTTPLLQDLAHTTIQEESEHWSSDGLPGLEYGRKAIAEVLETVNGGPRHGIERQAEMDERMRLAHHREWDRTEIPEGVHSAAQLDEVQRIKAAHGGRGTVEILPDDGLGPSFMDRLREAAEHSKR
jgi:pimeloyl-ACP methyl ester carboxylesterase